MRYAQIRSMDISNGENVGVSLFVQGCSFHCHNCFNQETWDFNGGKEWTKEVEKRFLELIDRPYIKRVSFLGGECLASQNLADILNLISEIRQKFPTKTIWLYTGYDYQTIFRGEPSCLSQDGLDNYNRRQIISMCDVVVDGEYIDELKDSRLKFKGSSNQRVIDVKKSLKEGRIILYCD